MGELDQPGTATVPGGAQSFDFEGQTYQAGDTLQTTDACRLVNFASAFQAANPGSGRANSTPNAWQTFQNACTAGPTATPGDITTDAGTAGNPAQHGGDSGADQGAPAPVNPSIDATSPPADPSTTTPSQTDEPRRPQDGQTDAAQVRDTPQEQVTVSDPVDAFAGAYVTQETDLEVPNTVLPLALVRSYRSSVAAFGPFGWNWDHNFDVYLRELATGNIAIWRTLHEDVFVDDGVRFEPPRGVFERLERGPAPGQSWVLHGTGGTVQRFERPAGWVDGERIPLVRIEDRHGNALRLTYGALDHLVEVRDDDDRYLHFDYDDCGLLVAVTDHTGRRYMYTHDEETFHLETVTAPPTSDHPQGIVRRYHYADPGGPVELRHNIVRVEDASGRTYLEISYEEDPASISFARVTEQLFGAYLYQYEYTELQVVPADDAFVNVPAWRTEVMNPDYGVETYTFNFRGDLLDERLRLVKDRSYRIVVTAYEYDRNGSRTATTRADGSQELRVYDDANPDAVMRGLLLRRELTAAAGFPIASRIVWRGRYEQRFGLLVEERDETGAMTAYDYDFDVTPGAATNTGKLKRVIHPDVTLPDGTTQAGVIHFEHNARGMVTATLDANGLRTEMAYGVAGITAGRLVSRTRDAGGIAATETYEYDAFGYRAAVVDAAGHRTGKLFNALGQVERVTLPAVGGATAEQVTHYDDDRRVNGFEHPRGDYDDPVLAGAPIADRIVRDVLGNPTYIELSINTAAPRMIRSQYDHRGFPLRSVLPDGTIVDRVYDERGRLIAETFTGNDGTRQRATTAYGLNGNLVRTTAPGGAATRYEYDGFGRLRLVTTPNGTEIHRTWGAGDVLESVEARGADDQGVIRLLAQTDYAYDERLRRTGETVKSYDDDPATAVDVTTTYFYDAGDRVVRTVDQRGATTSFDLDGLGRVVRITDPILNETEQDYDILGNLVTVRHRDIEPDGTTSVITTAYMYDERGRRTATVMPDGSQHLTVFDDRDLAVLEIDPLGIQTEVEYDVYGIRVAERLDPGGLAITHRWELDAVGRTTAYVDPTGATSTYELDGLGRRIRSTLPDGQTSVRAYDAAGNVVRETLASGVRLDYGHDAANRLTQLTAMVVPIGVAGVADQHFTYDGLDRLVLARAGADQVARRYDSRGRLRREHSGGAQMICDYADLTGQLTKRWPDGRVETIDTDLAGLPTTIAQTSAGALGTGNGTIAQLASSGPAHLGGAMLGGSTIVTATYDERKRLVALDASSPAGLGEVIAYRYDAADHRRLEVRNGVGAERKLHAFDVATRVIQSARGFVLPLAPPTDQGSQTAAIAAAEAAVAAARETFGYDAADARVLHAPAGQPPVAYANGPAHAPVSAGAEMFTHGPDGVRSSDGQFTYVQDALGRIVSVSSSAAMVCALEYDALGRPSVLRETGRAPRALTWFGNRVEQESDGAAVVRQHTRDPATGSLLAHHVMGDTHFPLFDARANLICLTGAGGTLLEAYQYDTFGTPTILDATGVPIATSAYDVAPVFGGQRYLPSIERYLSTRRLLDPRHGIFLSGDPLGYVSSPSLYAYAAQDPLDLIDPEGEFAFLAILVVMAIGAVVAGGLNAARQGIQMSENPARRRQGFSWSELGISMGIGAGLAPVLVVAPELAVPLAAVGVAGGVREMSHGNYATGTFDIITSLAPFGFKGVRGSVAGEGTLIGGVRGLGPSAPWSVRAGRFNAINQSLTNFRPAPFGRNVGPGIARPPGAAAGGHAGVVIQDAEGGFTLFHKNAQRTEFGDLEASWARDSPPPDEYWFGPGRPMGRWSYNTLRVPSSTADAMSAYAAARQAAPEPFVFYERSCSNFAADVMGEGGFRGLTPTGRQGASGFWQNWANFAPAFNDARNMSYSAGFWSSAHASTPNAKCAPAN